jgi:hypothetical protein
VRKYWQRSVRGMVGGHAIDAKLGMCMWERWWVGGLVSARQLFFWCLMSPLSVCGRPVSDGQVFFVIIFVCLVCLVWFGQVFFVIIFVCLVLFGETQIDHWHEKSFI